MKRVNTKYLLSGFLLISQFGIAQNAKEIVRKYLDVVSNGNVQNWSKIKTIYIEGVSGYSQNSYEQRLFSLTLDKPSYSKTFEVLPFNKKIESYEDSSYRTLKSELILLKTKRIVRFAHQPQMVSEQNSRDDYSIERLPVFILKLMDSGANAEVLGTQEFSFGATRCYKIKLNLKNRNYLLYINDKNYLLEYFNGREDEDQSFIQRLSDYRNIDNLLIPMSEFLIKNENIFYWSEIKRIIFNQEIRSEIFK